MRIPIDREKKLIILKWLKRGYIDTEDCRELNDVRENWFLELMKRTGDEELEQDNETND